MANKVYTIQGKKYIRKVVDSFSCDGCIFKDDVCVKPAPSGVECIDEPITKNGTTRYIFKKAPKKRKKKC